MQGLYSIEFIRMQSGKTLKMLRIIKGLTQREVADEIGITQQAYSKIEKKEWVDEKKFTKILLLLKYSKRELENILNLGLNI